MTTKALLKYQGSFFCAMGWGGVLPSRNSPQCLHLMASSWISSAQKGHFFIGFALTVRVYLLGVTVCIMDGSQ